MFSLLGFVRAAEGQGVSLAVIMQHKSRARPREEITLI
jgi:hypothetical protein